MATQTLDLLGLKCPQPVLKIATLAKDLPAGETVEILADCESFPKDIAAWCTKTGKTLMFCVDEGGGKFKAQIQF